MFDITWKWLVLDFCVENEFIDYSTFLLCFCTRTGHKDTGIENI